MNRMLCERRATRRPSARDTRRGPSSDIKAWLSTLLLSPQVVSRRFVSAPAVRRGLGPRSALDNRPKRWIQALPPASWSCTDASSESLPADAYEVYPADSCRLVCEQQQAIERWFDKRTF